MKEFKFKIVRDSGSKLSADDLGEIFRRSGGLGVLGARLDDAAEFATNVIIDYGCETFAREVVILNSGESLFEAEAASVGLCEGSTFQLCLDPDSTWVRAKFFGRGEVEKIIYHS